MLRVLIRIAEDNNSNFLDVRTFQIFTEVNFQENQLSTAFNIKGKGSETVKPNKNESMSKTKLVGATFMQIGL